MIRNSFIALSILAAITSSAIAKEQTKEKDKDTTPNKHIVGYLEKIVVQHIDQEFEAKLDTGADTTSIHAEVIELQKPDKENGEEGYVIFTIEAEGKSSGHIKKPLKRMVKIVSRTSEKSIRRPVVEMTFCIAGRLITEEVNLADRDKFNYDVLVGRNMLENAGLVVDSGNKYTTKPNCPEPEEVVEGGTEEKAE